jgi:uncharacterized protein YciI
MKQLVILAIIFFRLPAFAQQEFPMEFGGDSVTMKQYYFCMLKSGPNADKIDSVSLAKLQAAHLAHLGELYKKGKACIIGPMGDDAEWRGIIILNVASLKEAEELVAADPTVKAGRITFEIHPWWGVKGAALK